MAMETSPQAPAPVRQVANAISGWVDRLGPVWVEGQVAQFNRRQGMNTVFMTLRDTVADISISVTCSRQVFDSLNPPMVEGASVVVHAKPSFYANRGTLSLYARDIRMVGLGELLARIERRRQLLAAEGLFAAERKRPLPFLPRRIGLVTGNDAAAKRDVLTVITTRFPPASVLVAETYVQGPRAAGAVIEALTALCREGVEVVVVARGGGSFEDLLPFSDERLVRAIASCPVPVVTAVGHEQDTPLCDLVADVRASTPSVAGRLVVPDLAELLERLGRARSGLERGARRSLDRERQRLSRAHERLGRAPRLLLERGRARLEHTAGRLRALSPQSTLERGYAIVRANEQILRSGQAIHPGERVEVELAEGGFGARVEETK
jgi:exodeoxyribonuclease VII large subunit